MVKVMIEKIVSLDDFVDEFVRACILVRILGYDFWSGYLGVSRSDLVSLYDNFEFTVDNVYLSSWINRVWNRRLIKNKILKEFIMKEVVRRLEDGSIVLRGKEEFKPTKMMISFANWVVEHSGVLRNVSWNLDELARHSGIRKTLLKKWYSNPLFVRWFNEYCIEKMGFAISLLKLNIIGEALSEKASFAERKFALELVGEYNPNKGREDTGPIQIYIFGDKVNFGSSDGNKDKLSR